VALTVTVTMNLGSDPQISPFSVTWDHTRVSLPKGISRVNECDRWHTCRHWYRGTYHATVTCVAMSLSVMPSNNDYKHVTTVTRCLLCQTDVYGGDRNISWRSNAYE